MAKQFQEQEFEASVSDQFGLLRSRVPTPMLKALKAQHGDLIHYTMTGPDSVEIKVRRGRGYSGEKPYMKRETTEKKGNGKDAKPAKSSKGSKKSAHTEKSGKSSGKGAKKAKTKKKVLFDLGDLI